ncbi:hypothetical protein Tco_0410146 [Tanacetum coccineum]
MTIITIKPPKPSREQKQRTSSTRTKASTRYKAKDRQKPVTPSNLSPYQKKTVILEQAKRDRDMQKNLALPCQSIATEWGIQFFNYKVDLAPYAKNAGSHNACERTTRITRIKDDDVPTRLSTGVPTAKLRQADLTSRHG